MLARLLGRGAVNLTVDRANYLSAKCLEPMDRLTCLEVRTLILPPYFNERQNQI